MLAAFLYAPVDEITNLVFRYGKASKAQRATVREVLESLPLPPLE